MAGEGVNLALQRLDTAGEVRRQRDEFALVDQNAGGLHPGQDGDQRSLDSLVHRCQSVGHEARPNHPLQAEREIGMCRRGIPQRLRRDCVDGDPVAPAAEHVRERRRRTVEMELGQVLECVAMQAAVEHPGGQHRIVNRGERYAVRG